VVENFDDTSQLWLVHIDSRRGLLPIADASDIEASCKLEDGLGLVTPSAPSNLRTTAPRSGMISGSRGRLAPTRPGRLRKGARAAGS